MSTNLTRRLTRLEARHKQILRCAWCRYVLRNITDERKHKYETTPAGVLSTKCWYCGTPYILRLSSTDKHYREAADLVHNSHPVKRLTDERIHAAELWLPLSKSKKEKYLEDQREKAEYDASSRPSPRPAYKPTIKLNAQERKAKAERDDLQARARVFILAKQEEFKRRAGRTEPFPIDQTLEALEAGRVHSYHKAIEAEAEALGLEKSRQPYYSYTAHLVAIKNSIVDLKKREACEVVIWGESLANTLEEIAFFETQLPVAATEALEEQREARAKAECEAVERQRQLAEYRARKCNEHVPPARSLTSSAKEHWLVTKEGSKSIEMVEILSEMEEKPDPTETLKALLPPSAYSAYKEAQELANKTKPPGYMKFPGSPFERKEPEQKPPADDGTMLYQRKLAHWKRTRVWLPDHQCPADWYF
jgi:hypothetical protein